MRAVALVTGAGLRIGRGVAIALGRACYAVAVHHNRSAEAAGETVAAIRAAGGEAQAFGADLADPDAPARLVAAVEAALGAPTLLVNSAALFEADDARHLDLARWERQFAVNLRAPVWLAGALAARLPADAEGAVVNLIDQRVLRPGPGPGHLSYALSKAALHAGTSALAQGLAPRVRVNAVAPGPVLPNEADGDAGFRAEAAATPLGRPVPVAEIAEAVLFLARSPSVTGQTIAVDSGQHLAWDTGDVRAVAEAAAQPASAIADTSRP